MLTNIHFLKEVYINYVKESKESKEREFSKVSLWAVVFNREP